VKLARTFITNFHSGKEKGAAMKAGEFDTHIYEPYLCESGVQFDPQYEAVVAGRGDAMWGDKDLLQAGKAFAKLDRAQHEAVRQAATQKKLRNIKGFRNKALTASVISAWAFVAGLLQSDPKRLTCHYGLPKTTKAIPDPLNSREMSSYSHDSDDPTYRGLGTRSAIKDRQRMAQLFLARTLEKDAPIDKALMDKAVSRVVGTKWLEKGYTP
jgi:hypothetical protein